MALAQLLSFGDAWRDTYPLEDHEGTSAQPHESSAAHHVVARIRDMGCVAAMPTPQCQPLGMILIPGPTFMIFYMLIAIGDSDILTSPFPGPQETRRRQPAARHLGLSLNRDPPHTGFFVEEPSTKGC